MCCWADTYKTCFILFTTVKNYARLCYCNDQETFFFGTVHKRNGKKLYELFIDFQKCIEDIQLGMHVKTPYSFLFLNHKILLFCLLPWCSFSLDHLSGSVTKAQTTSAMSLSQ